MHDKMQAVINSTKKLIASLENLDIEGPIPFLEEAICNIEQAQEEWELYHGEEEE
jgi:hypothetical protein